MVKTTNLQVNKELIDEMLERLEKDKILEPYYEFIEPSKVKEKIKEAENGRFNKQTKRSL